MNCNPEHCDFSEAKRKYEFVLTLAAIAWGVFMSARSGLIVAWGIGVWVAVNWLGFPNGDAEAIQKSLVEPELLKWSIPKVGPLIA